jgi:hypothetical protein
LKQIPAQPNKSPRPFGKPTSVWTLGLAAEVSVAEGITAEASVTRPSARRSTAWAQARQFAERLLPLRAAGATFTLNSAVCRVS